MSKRFILLVTVLMAINFGMLLDTSLKMDTMVRKMQGIGQRVEQIETKVFGHVDDVGGDS